MINKNDFIEIEFTGRVSGTDEIFDTNVKENAKKINLDLKDAKPLILSVGQGMLPVGFDSNLVGKDVGVSYVVDIKPGNAFGKRDPKMIKMIQTKLFHEQKINPVRGMQLNLDGQLVKILSSDRGRTLVDFNNPLAGKDVSYEYRINRVVTDDKEKIDALQEFFFRKTFDFELKDKIITFKVEKQFEPFINMLSGKFEEILGLKIKVSIVNKEK